MNSAEDTAAIIDYWRAIELFSPQKIPAVDPTDGTEPVFASSASQLLPWDPAHALKRRPLREHESRRFTVYCGVLATSEVLKVLENRFGKDEESFDERNDSETCLFAFSVTDDGRPLFQTAVLSTCAWATSRTLSPGPTSSSWLDGFDKQAVDVASDFEHSYSATDDDEQGQRLIGRGFRVGRRLTHDDLLAVTTKVALHLDLTSLLPDRGIRIRAGTVATKNEYTAQDNDFLNSFYMADLALVASAARAGDIGKGLADFLSTKPNLTARIDVRQSIGTLFEQLAPSFFPRGRWPSKGHHPLVFSQQFAINTMTRELGASSGNGAGVFAVNGPPGTGKTTLLRDLISSVVVERAMHLSVLSKPADAFEREGRWKVDKYNRVVSIWKEQFNGFEIVIASANNGAVENVTREIPGVDAVDASWLDSIDYFSDFGSRILGAPAWALVAARLGNKSNRSEFVGRLWFDDQKANKKGDQGQAAQGLMSLLKSAEQQSVDWQKATARFKAVVASEEALRATRHTAHQIYARLAILTQEIAAKKRSRKELETEQQVAAEQMHFARCRAGSACAERWYRRGGKRTAS